MTPNTGRIDEYLSSNGLMKIAFHVVDQAWGYREKEPVFAFINAPADGSMSFQNALSLYWATAEYISRPWCLIMTTEAPMMSHHKQMLDNLGFQYRILVHETPSETQLHESVKSQLSELTQVMNRYIDPEDKNPSLSLGESIRGWRTQKPVFEEEYKVDIKLGDLSQYEVNGVLAPSRTTVPLTVQSGPHFVEGILLRLIQTDPLVFYTEHRNLPIVLRVDIGEKTFTTRFEVDKSNLIEASSYESLMTAFKSREGISFIDQNTGKNVFDLSVFRRE